MKDFILIGMPGCGKTTIGKQVAKALNLPFVDLDAEIELEAEMPIPQIFEEMGEEGFRKIETKTFANTVGKGRVIATGGGIVTRPENRPIAKKGLVIFIDRPLEQIMGDVRTDTRPLLSEGKERLIRLHEQRDGLYRDFADIVVVNDGSKQEILEKILNEVKSDENYGD